jgi:thermitase
MLIYIYIIGFFISLSGLIGWFYVKDDAKKSRLMSSLFLGGFLVYLLSLAFSELDFGQKLWSLFRDLTVLGATSQFLGFFRKQKLLFFSLLTLVYGFGALKYGSVMQQGFHATQNDLTTADFGLAKEGELLLDLADNRQISTLNDLIKRYDLEVTRAFPNLKSPEKTDLDDYYLVNIPTSRESEMGAIKKALAENTNVDWVENNEILTVSPQKTPVISRPAPSYGINDPGLENLWGFEQMQIAALYQFLNKNKTQPKKTALIAILDTGVDADHEDIRLNYKKIRSKYSIDEHGHGTHCAGIAAAVSNNGKGIASFAPNNGFYQVTSIQVLSKNGSGSQQDIIKGIIEAAENGADVISLSLGGPSNDSKQRAYESAVAYANEKGSIVVVAAGNSNQNAKDFAPANARGVITVSAVDEALSKAIFSNTVQDLTMGIAAPGVNVYSCTPNNGYQAWNGTSMATPYVAGLLGLMRAVRPDLTTKAAYEILKQTGIETGSTDLTGKFIQPKNALESTLKN